MAQLAKDPTFIALHEKPVQNDFTPKYGQMQSVAGGSRFVVPASPGAHGGVLLFHEWWGLNNNIRETAEKLHQATGDGVIAVDLYGGKVATTPQQASSLVQSVREDAALQQIHETVDAVLQGHVLGDSVTKIGTMGYCFGGGYSLETALADDDAVKACVMYYGHPELDLTRLNRLNAPLLGFFGSQDKGITPKLVDKFKTALKEDRKHFHIYSYDTPHAFANPSNPHYNKEATEDSWKKTVAFFRRELS